MTEVFATAGLLNKVLQEFLVMVVHFVVVVVVQWLVVVIVVVKVGVLALVVAYKKGYDDPQWPERLRVLPNGPPV